MIKLYRDLLPYRPGLLCLLFPKTTKKLLLLQSENSVSNVVNLLCHSAYCFCRKTRPVPFVELVSGLEEGC